ncbi:MAG: L-aspartate oxidase [Salibacteraceae bacterium]|jgi:L-aspartate oxidase
MRHSDYLIIGSGIAGLSLSIKLAEKYPDKKITVITKTSEEESNTRYAQGGIAVVLDLVTDSFDKHIEDTLRAGAGLSDPEVVKMVVQEAPERLKEMISWGAAFDTNRKGNLDLAKEGGHSEKRIVHHKDITGYEMAQALIRRNDELENVNVYEHFFAIELITEHHIPAKEYDKNNINCYGAYVINKETNEVEIFEAEYTILATGGIGQVYQYTTNPKVATGDGIAMAYRAKAQVEDLQFVQFHPTALYEPRKSPAFLISEAVRGFGAHLVHSDGERFVFNYDDRGELASRDIVARAIDSEMKIKGVEHVFLDCSHLDQKEFLNHFPNIYHKCLETGIDLFTDYIPVVPAAHYVAGGIVVDKSGHTTINRLYASGEVSKTGLHGANRLASNSLLEALVYSHHIFLDITARTDLNEHPKIPEWNDGGMEFPRELALINHTRHELRQLMSNYVAIVRSDIRLERALKRLKLIWEETEELYEKSKLSVPLCELRNLVGVSFLMIKQSQKQKSNAGGFYNVDFENNNDE